jgi:hypothetical protein
LLFCHARGEPIQNSPYGDAQIADTRLAGAFAGLRTYHQRGEEPSSVVSRARENLADPRSTAASASRATEVDERSAQARSGGHAFSRDRRASRPEGRGALGPDPTTKPPNAMPP